MIENYEFCNSTGVTRIIGFKAGLVNCRVAAYLNLGLCPSDPKRFDRFGEKIYPTIISANKSPKCELQSAYV